MFVAVQTRRYFPQKKDKIPKQQTVTQCMKPLLLLYVRSLSKERASSFLLSSWHKIIIMFPPALSNNNTKHIIQNINAVALSVAPYFCFPLHITFPCEKQLFLRTLWRFARFTIPYEKILRAACSLVRCLIDNY